MRRGALSNQPQLGNKFVGQMDVSPFTIQSADTEKSLFWVAGFWINPVKQFTSVNNVSCKKYHARGLG